MTWTLTWKHADGPQPLDGSVFCADLLGCKSRKELDATVLPIGRSTRSFAELFTIEGKPSNELVLRNLPRLDRIGAGMASGRLIIEGNVGDDLGASIFGGQIIVQGNAGDRVGGADQGATRGMTGGEIAITGDAGHHVGHLMRRGLISVGGKCGHSPGYRMLAGTIVIARGPLDHPGLEMQRGTIICLEQDNEPTAGAIGKHLSKAGVMSLGAMPAVGIVVRRVAQIMNKEFQSDENQRVRLWHGDRFELNKGEVMQWL